MRLGGVIVRNNRIRVGSSMEHHEGRGVTLEGDGGREHREWPFGNIGSGHAVRMQR